MMNAVADIDFAALITMVREDRGIDLTTYKEKFLRRRVGVRLRASRAWNLNHYLKLLRQNAGEYDDFIDAVTVNTSSFFRNPSCFEVLGLRILPAVTLMAGVSPVRPPLFWSVGCSRGEEAYSLAILVAAVPVLPRDPASPLILGTDISVRVLEDARRGVFGARSLADLPPGILERSFRREGRMYRIAGELQGTVRFLRHDIIRDRLPGKFLVVLCRNLLIYLEREAQERVMLRLAEAIHPGGYLMLGRSEMLVGQARDLFVPVYPAERIYQRINNHDHVAEAGMPARRSG